MDRNQVTGLLLIFLMVTVYLQFFAPQAETIEDPSSSSQEEKNGSTKQQAVLKAKEDGEKTLDPEEAKKNFGSLAELTQGKSKTFTLENEEIKIDFDTQGGKVKSVLLKKYKDHEDKTLVLQDQESSQMRMLVRTSQGKSLDLLKLYYQAETKDVKTKAGINQQITFTAQVAKGKYIRQVYTLGKEGYSLDYDLEMKGLEKEIQAQDSLQLYWKSDLKRFETDLYYSRYYTTINYYTADDDYSYLSWPSTEQEVARLDENLHWFSFKQRFFSSAFIAKHDNLGQALLVKNTDENDSSVVKTAEAQAKIALADIRAGKGAFQFYFGPNDYNVLKKVEAKDFDQNVYLGWSLFAVVSKFVIIPLFNFLEQYFNSYGIIIILMVFIIKTALLPLTYTSYKSMAKMKVLNELLKPELEAFKKKEGLDRPDLSMEEQSKVQQEQMRLYGELGSSPFAAMSGCIPLVLQMPILFALFVFFPNAIQLRQESFLWAHDLSTYDSILNLPFYIPGYGAHVSLFTLLMTASTLLLSYFNSQSQANMQGPMKYMMYIFPVVFMFVLNSYPAGLSFYYLMQNSVTIGQQTAFKKFLINEDKIRNQFETYKAQNKGKTSKKSGLIRKLEEARNKQMQQKNTKNQNGASDAKNNQNNKQKRNKK